MSSSAPIAPNTNPVPSNTEDTDFTPMEAVDDLISFYEFKEKQYPEPKVVYWGEDKEWANQTSIDPKRKKMCPEHGISQEQQLPGDFPYGGVGFGCPACMLIEKWSHVEGYEDSVILKLAKGGFRGNRIPKDANAFAALLKWRKDRKNWDKEYVRLQKQKSKEADILKVLRALEREGKIKWNA